MALILVALVAARSRGGQHGIPAWREVPGFHRGPPGGRTRPDPFFSPVDYRRYTDDAQVPRPRPAQRIVAASILSAEVLLAIGERERLVGVHELVADPRYSSVGAQAKGLTHVGAEPESMLAVRPDLVFTDAFTRAETQQLLEYGGATVVRTHPFADFDDVADNLRLVGWAVDRAAAAEALVQEMGRRLAAVRAAARECRGWRVMNLNGALDTCGRGSLVDAVIAATGATNVAAAHGVGPYRKLDVESVLAWRPDALVLALAPGETATPPEWLRQVPGLELLPCVQQRRFVYVPAALLGSTSQHVVGAAEVIQAQLKAWGRS